MGRHRTPDNFSDEPLTDEELDAYLTSYAERWKLRRYAILGDLLPEAERAEYERLAAKYEDLREDDPLFYGEPRVRRIVPRGSPKSADDMRIMAVAEIVSFLQAFQPGDGWEEPDAWDIGRELSSAVASHPARFASEAESFRGTDPTYVHALLWGFHDALRKQNDGEVQEARDGGPSFAWRPVLALCRWVLAQPRRASEEQYVGGRDVGWGPTLRQVAWLVRDGLLKSGEFPFELRIEAWELLERLAEDPDPKKEYEEEAAKMGRPPLTPNHFSINTVRGVAMHAVLAYVLWVYRHLSDDEIEEVDDARGRWQGLDDVPEARGVLDRHLDPVAEPTRTVRSVYGTWLPTLVYLDRRWIEDKLPEIFPRDEAYAYLRDAAWDTYVAHRSPRSENFELLRDEYARAVEQLAERRAADDGKRRRPDPESSLAEHLLILYWRGTLGFGEPDGLLERFYALASDELRAHAAGFVGRVLAKENATPDALARLEELWERRLESAEEDSKSMSEELGAFGWWFLSGKFGDERALTHLDRALALGGDVGHDAYSVVNRLAAVAPQHPRLAVGCLDKIVRKILAGSLDSRWRMLAIDDDALRVLIAAHGGDHEARQVAHELANVLVARGYPRFETLL
jgi:hypothetical protein